MRIAAVHIIGGGHRTDNSGDEDWPRSVHTIKRRRNRATSSEVRRTTRVTIFELAPGPHLDVPIHTLNDLFFRVLEIDRDECLLETQGEDFKAISAADLGDRVMRLEASLEAFGIQPGERVALMANNGVHWPTVDFAVLGHGAVVVPVYPTLTAEQAAYVINDCGARLVFVEEDDRLDGLLEIAEDMPLVEQWVLIGGKSREQVPNLEDFSSTDFDRQAFEQRARNVAIDDLATFIYTSGTTGNPKGVMLTHGNLASNIEAGAECLNFGNDYVALSFLPLSHSFERTVDYIYFYSGINVAYAESIHTVARDFGRVNPHVFVSVPRVYEKVLAKVQEAVASGSSLRRRLFAWAVSVGKEALPYRLAQTVPKGSLKWRLAVADRLVFSKIRARLGSRFEKAVSGGAPLGRETAEFFWGAGIEIYEGYGLSETSPVLCVNRPGGARIGSVGPPITGVELKIDEDGEILARGPNIMRGYHNLPDETAACFTADGWFRTGDIGTLDEDGYLFITDRKKEILVNAYGKNIAPAPIENALKSSPYVEHAVVLGDRQKFLAAILVPDQENLSAWAHNQGLGSASLTDVVTSERFLGLLATHIETINEDLSRYQQIRKWEVVPTTFSIEGGELTPTQKIKRRIVADKYAEVIDRLYDEP